MSSSPSPQKPVDLHTELSVKYIEKSSRPIIAKQVFETFDGHEVTDPMLKEAANLFNENYGIWGADPTGSQRMPKQGELRKDRSSRVSNHQDRKSREAEQRSSTGPIPTRRCRLLLRKSHNRGSPGRECVACRWNVKDKTVCWITQLVVHGDYRERGLASSLLNCLRRDDDDIYGLMSSHPAACLAAAKACGSGINSVAMGFIRDNASSVMKQSPTEYVRKAVLRGNLFEPDDTSGVISSVCTDFFVDHAEPLEALHRVRQGRSWPLGELLDGHEFLLMIETRLRSRSGSRSASQPGV